MPKRSLGRVSTAELQRELAKRRSTLNSLMDRRDTVAAQLEEIESEIASLGGTDKRASAGRPGRKRKRGRPRKTGSKATAKRGRGGSVRFRGARTRAANSMTLIEALAKVLKGKTMGVTEVANAVQKAGYKTNSDNFRTIVNQTLIKNPKIFKKPARGQYTAA